MSGAGRLARAVDEVIGQLAKGQIDEPEAYGRLVEAGCAPEGAQGCLDYWAGRIPEGAPDWCLAPSAALTEWLEENGLTAHTVAAAWEDGPEVAAVLAGVLAREPLTQRHAAVLGRVTGTPAPFWLRWERDYRAGLAAGRKDVTDQ